MSDFRTPISELRDAPQDFQDGLNLNNVQARAVPAAQNYAKSPEMCLRAQNEIWPLVDQARRDRKSVESGWQQIRRMTLMVHDENQRYKGRTNLYLPVHAKNTNTQITNLSKGMFPSDEYLDVARRTTGNAALDMMDKESSIKAKHYMQYQFEQIAKVRMYMKLFSRQLLDYGFSVLKFWYRKPQSYAKASSKKFSGLNMQGLAQIAYGPEFQVDTQEQGLTVSARNIFHFYGYPFNAETLRETVLQFEDIEMSQPEVEAVFKQGDWANKDAIAWAPRPSDLQTDYQQNLSDHDVPNQEGTTGSRLGDRRMVTECYTFMELPASEYTENDAPGCPLPVRIVFLDSQAVSIRRNPNYHQSSPYLGLSLNASPGFMLGMGPGKMIAPLQYLANDLANQVNDNGIYALNPIVKAIPGMLVGGLRPMAPGVTWYMNDLNAVAFERPPFEQVQMGMNMLNSVISQAQDFGGAPPVLQGTNAGKGAKTATSSQILQHNSQLPLQDLVEDIENEIFIPLMGKAWKLAQQHAPDSVLASVFGITREITRDDLQFEATWRWLASSQSANAQQRAYQTINFLQQLANPAVLQLLGAQGKTVDIEPVLRRIYTDALGFKGFDEIVKPLPMPPPGMPGQAPMPGQPPAGQEGEAPRSAMEQTPGGGVGMQAGEGEAFGEVRQGADDISSMLGGMGQ